MAHWPKSNTCDDKKATQRTYGNNDNKKIRRAIQRPLHVGQKHTTKQKSFFKLLRESDESPQQTWEKLLDVERNCKFRTISAEELIIAKFSSLRKEK